MRWLLCLSFLLFQFYAEAQSIYTVLRITDETSNKGKVKLIDESRTFYRVSGIIKESRVLEYNENQQLLVEKRYSKKEGKYLEVMFGYENGQKAYRKRTAKSEGGFSTEFNSYNYSEEGHLIETVYYDSDSVVTIKAALVNNENGHPIQLKKIRDEELIGIEEARYDYRNNRVYVRVLNEFGDLISEVDYTVDLKLKNPEFTYDELGNVIAFPRNVNETDQTYSIIKYKYDDIGNWTTMTIYWADKRGDKYAFLIKDRVFKRKITYYE
tara:strand:- start:712 stop:1515 length:804 start_codon:yes stop_codon:yes gene_type:complete